MRTMSQDILVRRCMSSIYDAAVDQSGWDVALQRVANIFHAGFADLCTWTHDRRYVNGMVHGLDSRDYHDNLLGHWFNRNVWGRKAPARIPGEVLSTRNMVAREELCSSDMYHDYLHERGLHEGLRLTLWSDGIGLGDVSLLRPWSGGAFGPAEVGLGRALLPHLQRAVAITRRLRAADFQLKAAEVGANRGDIASIAFGLDGRPFWFNAVALRMLEAKTPLRLVSGALQAATSTATRDVARIVARCIGQRQGGAAMLPRAAGLGSVKFVIVPLSHRDDWSLPRPPAAMAFLRTSDHRVHEGEALNVLFGFTTAEGELAQDLLSGATVVEIAARTGRSANTVRTHLARLMNKTGTRRQVDLVRLLDQATDLRASPTPPPRPGDPFAWPASPSPAGTEAS